MAELAYQGDALAAPAPLATLKHWGFLAGNRGDRLAITREGLLQVDRLFHEFVKPEHNTGRYA